MNRTLRKSPLIFILLVLLAFSSSGMRPRLPDGQQADPTPPQSPVKLVFIHHSTGGNWLADPAGNDLGGGLGRALMENNYYASATNYGWGPDSIGDATDIPNWLDWFRSERSPAYLDALYNEGGQNFGDFGSWPRLSADPGGENQVIVFKSCFPNSDLEGRPGDPPDPEGWLSVGHAKYVYNEILQYFATRPDKLFVVVTAPPLIRSGNAANARAFNLWLVNDWLAENNYTLNNVAVFDFYNVLTAADAHHRVVNGEVEHTFKQGQNLLHYPSGDDHPSREGNQKATAEFVPMLNAFYNRWKATAPEMPPLVETPAAAATVETGGVEATAPAAGEGFAEDFEGTSLTWEAFYDEGGTTRLACTAASDQAYSDRQSLQLEYTIAGDGWATCSHSFNSAQDWSSYSGLAFALQSAEPGRILHVDLYAGSPDSQESYYYAVETPDDSRWTVVTIPWEEIRRVDWEENAGQPFSSTGQVLGIAFGFPGTGGDLHSGTVWVDDIHLLAGGEGAPPAAATNTPAAPQETAEVQEEEPPAEGGRGPHCGGAFALPLVVTAGGWWLKRRRKEG